jgi:hypothetical protein
VRDSEPNAKWDGHRHRAPSTARARGVARLARNPYIPLYISSCRLAAAAAGGQRLSAWGVVERGRGLWHVARGTERAES